MSDAKFTCCVCHEVKDVFFLFRAAHGQEMCLWCAEDSGLTKKRYRSVT